MTVGPRVWRDLPDCWCNGAFGPDRICLPCFAQIQSRHGGLRAFAWAWRRTVLGPVRTLTKEQARNLVAAVLRSKP